MTKKIILMFGILILLLLVGCPNKCCCKCCYEETETKEYVVLDKGYNYWTKDNSCPSSYKWEEGIDMNLCHYPSEESAKDFYANYLKCTERKEGCLNIRECNLIRFNHQWCD